MATDVDALNLKQVARDLGVHYMTAYRYVRQGRLAARQVDGGWLVDRADLDRFRSERTVPTPDGSTAAGRNGPDGRRDRLRHRLRAGDEVGAWREIDLALAGGLPPEDVLARLLPEALGGEGPATPPGSVDDLAHDHDLALDYVATATATRLVDRLGARFARPGRARGTVLLASPSGEQHRLPLATVAALVRTAGFRAVELGADVPPGVIAAATAQILPLALGIGVTTAAGIEAAVVAIDRVSSAAPGVPVVVGGQAVRSPEVAGVLGTALWAPDGPAMVALLGGLASRRAGPTRGS